jgi:DNA-binding transcriptional ArsR family regulator
VVLELELTPQDLAHTRFAMSPLWEVVASVRVVKRPGNHAVHGPWQALARQRLAGVDWRLLSALVPVPGAVVPGFLAPPQPAMIADLDLELAALRAVGGDEVRGTLDRLDGPLSGRLVDLYDDPPAGLARLASEVRDYWDAALAPHWPRILSLLEGDIRHRARVLAEGGAHRLFQDLDPAVTWEGDQLHLDHRSASGRVRLAGRGLLLAPSVFIWPHIASVVVPPWQPTLRYPPRGVATLWEQRQEVTPAALARVLGRSRALLLTALDSPASTAALARATGLTPGGVSQHLTALRDAGLVSAHRSGRFVLYARTRLAEELVSRTGLGR